VDRDVPTSSNTDVFRTFEDGCRLNHNITELEDT